MRPAALVAVFHAATASPENETPRIRKDGAIRWVPDVFGKLLVCLLRVRGLAKWRSRSRPHKPGLQTLRDRNDCKAHVRLNRSRSLLSRLLQPGLMRTRTRSPFRQPPNTQEAYKKLSKDIWNPTDRPVFSDSRCLVFGRCGCGVKNSNERSRPPLSGECRLKRLVAGVSGYICDQCVTKCVAVLEQHADPR